MRKFFVCAVLFVAVALLGVNLPAALAQKGTKGPVIELNESAKDGRFRFLVKSAEGKTIALSIGAGYATEKDALKAIEDLKAAVGKATLVKNTKGAKTAPKDKAK